MEGNIFGSGMSMEETINEMKKEIKIVCTDGLPHKTVKECYRKMAPMYDQVLGPENQKGPRHAAEALADQVPGELRPTFKVLDIGAGTGFVGAQLNQLGFVQMEALEPSEELLSLAIKKNVYKKTFCSKIGGEPVDIKDDTYDGIITSGCFGGSHIPCEALTDMIRIVKPGGLIVIGLKEIRLTESTELNNRFEPFMKKLESAGAWKMIKREVRPDFVFGKNGVIYTCKVCIPGTVTISV